MHVKPGSVIVSLDDVELGKNKPESIASWEHFFDKNRRPIASPSLGWCVDGVTFFGKYGGHFLQFTVPNDTILEHTSDCCLKQSSGAESPPPPLVQLSCFVPTSYRQDTVHMGRCIDPVPVLAPSGQQQQVARCSSRSDCSDLHSEDTVNGMHSMECVQPSLEAQLLRITILPPPWEDLINDKVGSQRNSHVVLWSGPRDEVYEQSAQRLGLILRQTTHLPHFPSFFQFLRVGSARGSNTSQQGYPISRNCFSSTAFLLSYYESEPVSSNAFPSYSYLATISLALYVFNLYALPFLDGFHFLHALLDLIGQTRSTGRDLDMLEEGNEADTDLFDFEVGSGRVGSLWRRPSDMRNNASLRSVIWAVYSAVMQIRNWVRRRKTKIETTIRYSTITLMFISSVGMIWSSLM